MKKKAIIFDLDDTLYDTFSQVKIPALKAAILAMQEAGLEIDEEKGHKEILAFVKENPTADCCAHIAQKYGGTQEIGALGKKTLFSFPTPQTLETFTGTKEVLEELQKEYDLFIITTGIPQRQEEKINKLGINEFFTAIYYDDQDDEERSKKDFMQKVVDEDAYSEKDTFIVGDRINKEIRFGNELGLNTIRLLKGNYVSLQPQDPKEQADITIQEITELPQAIEKLQESEEDEEEQETPKVVNIGGGTAQPIMLRGLKKFTKNITAIVAVTDAGGSSKIMREELGIPPGDIQKCLVALAKDEKLLNELFLFRFKKGHFEGHTFGNLFIAALTEMNNSVEEGIMEASKLLNVQGQVLPSTLSDLHLHAKLNDGTELKAEPEVEDKAKGNVEKLFLSNPDAPANPLAVQAILEADVVLIGPGSLYTSVLPNILIKEIRQAIEQTTATVIYVCNIVTQPGETDGMDAKEHISEIIKYLGEDVLDYAIVNNRTPDNDLIERYKKENSHILTTQGVEELSIKIIQGDVIRDEVRPDEIHEKAHLLRHDPEKIIALVQKILTSS